MEPLPGVYETIGADGGSLRSEDGVLTVDIPAGALAEALEFRIVPTKDAPPSIGMAYHIEPSLSPSMPVLVTYSYAGVDVSDRDLEALRVGRDIGGEWEMLATDKADEAAAWVAAKDDEVSFNYGLVEEQHGVAVGDDDNDDDGDDAAEDGSDDGKGEPGDTDGSTDSGESDDGMTTGGEEPAGSSDGDAATTGESGSESTGGPGNGNGSGNGNDGNGD